MVIQHVSLVSFLFLEINEDTMNFDIVIRNCFSQYDYNHSKQLCFHKLTHNALKNLMQSFELVVSFPEFTKLVTICTRSVGESTSLLGQLKARRSLERFIASVGLSECRQFKAELDFILKTQSTRWNEVILSFNLRRRTSNLK